MDRLDRLNTTVALKIVLLLGFAAFFCMTVVTGTVRLYVHPRIIPFLLFAAAAMLVIALLLCRELFSPVQSTTRFWSLLLFVLPLLMALAIPPRTLDSASGTTGSVQLISNTAGAASPTVSASESASTPTADPANSTGDISQALPQIEMQQPSIVLQDGVLVLNSDNFYAGLCDVYDHLQDYKGVPISLVGSVFKDNESFSENQFVPARLMMVCCAADMQPAGLMCQYDGASQLTVDSWVKVEGVIGETTFEGETIPCILAESVTLTEAPPEPYIYPY